MNNQTDPIIPKEILRGHTSKETAYVCDDYPYGFRLRCKIRYWLEFRPNKGHRFVSQTTNPKVQGVEIWNKEKASTYTSGFPIMFNDQNNHTHWDVLDFYSDPSKIESFKQKYGSLLDEGELKRISNIEYMSRKISPTIWKEWDDKQKTI